MASEPITVSLSVRPRVAAVPAPDANDRSAVTSETPTCVRPWSARGSQGGSPECHPSGHWVVGEHDLKGAGVDERSLVVVDMQGHHDAEAVNQALLAGPAYIGLVRPRPRAKSMFEYLESRGLSKKALGGGRYRWVLMSGESRTVR